MEVGLLPEAQAKKLHAKVLKAKSMGKTIRHKTGKSKRSSRPKKSKPKMAYSDSDVGSVTDDDSDDWKAMQKQKKRRKKLGPKPSKIPSKRAMALQKATRSDGKRKRTDVEAVLRSKKKRKTVDSSDSDDDRPLLVAKSG